MNKINAQITNGENIEPKGDHLKYYFLSLYFTIQTVTTVGYGDVNPAHTGERIFVIFLMLTGVMLFSFMSGSLASVLQAYDDREQEERAMLDHLAEVK